MKFKNKRNAVLILSHLMKDKKALNNESILRCKKGFEIFHKKKCDFIITSGWKYKKEIEKPISHFIKDYLENKLGVDNKSIVTDQFSRETVGDAVFVKYNIIHPMCISELHIVSSRYHIPRVKNIFGFFFEKKITCKFYGVKSPLDLDKKILNNEKKSLLAFYSTFKNIDPRDKDKVFEILLSKHPYYNGLIFPKFTI